MRLARNRPVAVDAGDLSQAFRRFRPALRGQGVLMATAVVLSLGSTVLELVKPWPITWVVDHLTSGRDPGEASLGPILWFAGLAALVPALLGLANERLQMTVARVSRKATVRIRSDVYDHIHRLDMSHHQQQYGGDLLMRLMGDVNMIRDLLFPTWLNLLSKGSILIGGAVIFALVDWKLFLVALIPLPLLWVGLDRTSRAVKSASGRQRRKEGAIAAMAAESIRQVGLIKAFTAEDRSTAKFRSDARSAEKATMAATRHTARMARTTDVLTGVGVALVLVLGASRVRGGLLTTGEFIVAVSYTRMLYKPIRKLTAEGARVGKATACALRVIELLDQPVEDPHRGLPVTDLNGDIAFHDVSHAYPDGRRSLRSFDVLLPGGSLVAVTGENGAGKSTMLSLLLRLSRPSSGRITIGGADISGFRLGEYRDHIAFVPQELALFGGTIRENILFGNPEAGPAAVERAVDQALFRPVVERLPEGLDTVLDENGSSLSGGQARRLMLARAALRDASLLLLDEPLTGLDPKARSLVSRAIRNIAAGRTTLIVHHGSLAEIAPDVHLRLAHDDSPTTAPIGVRS